MIRNYNTPIRKKDNPEARLQLSILKYCKLKGFHIGKTKTMGVSRYGRFMFDPYTFRGFPDLCLFTPKLYFIEVKSPTGTQTEDQQNFQLLCEKAGVPYILARKIEDITNIL